MAKREGSSDSYVDTGNRLHRTIYAGAGLQTKPSPAAVPVLMESGVRGHAGVSVAEQSAILVRTASSFSLSMHQLGGPFVDIRRFIVRGYRPSQLMADFGPGTGNRLLPVMGYAGLGTQIDRDDPQVCASLREHPPVGRLWIRPGFPGTCHFEEWVLDGRKFQAVLASSITNPGGFVLLDASDVLCLYGYARRDVAAVDLGGLVPLEPMRKILSWAAALVEVPASNSI